MKYFIFLCFLIFHTNDVLAQLDIKVGKNMKFPIDELSTQQEENIEEDVDEDIEEDVSSPSFKRDIYGRYDSSKKKINVENKILKTILRPREDFKDRIRNSLGKY